MFDRTVEFFKSILHNGSFNVFLDQSKKKKTKVRSKRYGHKAPKTGEQRTRADKRARKARAYNDFVAQQNWERHLERGQENVARMRKLEELRKKSTA